MTLKHDRDADRPDESGVPDEKVDPLVQGWETALGGAKDEDVRNEPDAVDVARNEDLDENSNAPVD